MIKSAIIIPAYNEEKRIGKTVGDYAEYFGDQAKILIVLNGCRDKTGDIVRNLKNKYKNIEYIEFSEAIGKGGAVQEGFKHILNQGLGIRDKRFQLIGFVDADEATKPEEYERLANLMGEADGVIGSRFLKGARVSGRSVLRNGVGHIFHLIVKGLFNMPYKDTQCGVKIFKVEALERILPELKIKNMAFDVDLLVAARKNGLEIKEIPTIWRGQPASGSLGSPFGIIKNGWKMFWTLINLKNRELRSKEN